MSDKIIKFDMVSTKDICVLYEKILEIFQNSYSRGIIQKGYTKTDAREMFYKSVIVTTQTNVIFSHLLHERYSSDMPLLKSNSENEKISILTNLFNELRGNLMFNIFLRFENFIKLIAKSQGINGDNINKLSKDLRKHLNLDPDYDNLINIFTYIRNTIHAEGVHTRDGVSVTYKGKAYDFEKDSHISFIDNDFLLYLFTEVNKLVVDIIETDKIKNIPNIPHNISGFTYEY